MSRRHTYAMGSGRIYRFRSNEHRERVMAACLDAEPIPAAAPFLREFIRKELPLWLFHQVIGPRWNDTDELMAYDWYDCHQNMSYFMYWVAGCVHEMAEFE